MSVFKTKLKLLLVLITTLLVVFLCSVVAVLAAQQVAVNGNMNINYYAPKTLVTTLRNNLSTATTLTFDKYDTYKSNIDNGTFSQVTAVDAGSVGCEAGGISLYSSGTNYYVISKTEILAPVNCSSLFYNLKNLTSITFNNFNTENVTNMSSMFNSCSGLTTLNLSTFNTAKVTTMNGMFYYCINLSNLNLSNFNTANVQNMKTMFRDCSALSSVSINHFNTANVTSMNGMFYGCKGLTSLDISNFNTAKVTDMGGMFYGCNNASLTSFGTASTSKIKIGSNFKTNLVTNFSSMFSNCSKLTSLNVSGFVTTSATNMGEMFRGCSALTGLDISNFNTSKVTYMYGMFYKCGSTSVTSFGTSGSIKIGSNFVTTSVTDMNNMFNGSNLTSINLSTFNTSTVTSMYAMFQDCSKLTTITWGSNFTTAKVSGFYNMFYGCSSLTSLNVSHFNTSSAINMSGMFYGCSKLTSLSVTNFNTSKVYGMMQMFSGCSSLTSLNVSSFDTSNIANSSNYDASISYMFANCSNLTTLNLSNFRVGGVFSSVFMGCSKLKELDLSGFAASQYTTTTQMFYNCNALKKVTINPDIWNLLGQSSSNGANMFYGCNSLMGGAGTKVTDVQVYDGTYAQADGIDSGGYRYDGYFYADYVDLYTGDKFNEEISQMYSGETINKISFGKADDYEQCLEMYNTYGEDCALSDVGGFLSGGISSYSIYYSSTDSISIIILSPYGIRFNADSSGMFLGLDMQQINFYDIDTSKTTDMSYMFYQCFYLTKITNLNLFNTSSVRYMDYMFEGCDEITSIDCSSFNISNVTDFSCMFSVCTSLQTIYASYSWFSSSRYSSTSHAGMFAGCAALVGGSSTTFDSSNVRLWLGNNNYSISGGQSSLAMAYIDGGSSRPGYFTYKAK